MKKWTFLLAAVLLWVAAVPFALAQKGTGDAAGLARQAINSEAEVVTGTATAMVTEPCKMTTGRSDSCTHRIIETSVASSCRRCPGLGGCNGRGQSGQTCVGSGRQCAAGAGPRWSAGATARPRTDAGQLEALTELREEEKLAHDVYVALAEKWSIPVFANIAEAEARHIDVIERLIGRDSANALAEKEPVGKFSNSQLQQLYNTLVATGSASLADAYRVGAQIEEMDLVDLRKVLANAAPTDIRVSLQNLERASRNHLRAFAARLDAIGERYTASHLDQTEFDSIATSSWERGSGQSQRGRGRLDR